MPLFAKKKILVTHDSVFHADDLFSTAVLSLLLDGNISVIRTRDKKIIEGADYVYDVGEEYDPSRNRFDHHQKGGAGTRENGVPYAAFGLVWKTYGEKVCGSKEVAKRIDESLVQAVDAGDNGLDIYKVTGQTGPYLIENVVTAFRPSWKEGEEYDKPFHELVSFFKQLLRRKITKTKDAMEAESFIRKAYDEAPEKRLIVLPDSYPWRKMYMEYPEPLYVVAPKAGRWHVYAVPKEEDSYENRKSFPEAWGGLRDEELARITGVPDATFCHNARFLAVAKSKEGAIALAEKAVAA